MSAILKYFNFCLAKNRYGQSQGAVGYATALQQREFFENWALNNFVRVSSDIFFIAAYVMLADAQQRILLRHTLSISVRHHLSLPALVY